MSTDEALKIIEQVTGQVQASREVHRAIEQALQVLREAVNRQDDIIDQDGPL